MITQLRRRAIIEHAGSVDDRLVVTGLRKRFGVKIGVEDATFTVAPGEILGMIGPNGAGKSTVIEILSGNLRCDGGTAWYRGRNLVHLNSAQASRLGVARTFQKLRLYLNMSAIENVMIPLLVRGSSPRLARSEAMGVLTLVDLHSRPDVMASVLSTGQRKRLELARAIASGGRLLLLDEVTQGVDAATLECLVELIERLRRESGCSVLIVDHDMAVLKRLCDRLVALDLGIVIAEGAPDQVLAHADVVASYVSA